MLLERFTSVTEHCTWQDNWQWAYFQIPRDLWYTSTSILRIQSVNQFWLSQEKQCTSLFFEIYKYGVKRTKNVGLTHDTQGIWESGVQSVHRSGTGKPKGVC